MAQVSLPGNAGHRLARPASGNTSPPIRAVTPSLLELHRADPHLVPHLGDSPASRATAPTRSSCRPYNSTDRNLVLEQRKRRIHLIVAYSTNVLCTTRLGGAHGCDGRPNDTALPTPNPINIIMGYIVCLRLSHQLAGDGTRLRKSRDSRGEQWSADKASATHTSFTNHDTIAFEILRREFQHRDINQRLEAHGPRGDLDFVQAASVTVVRDALAMPVFLTHDVQCEGGRDGRRERSGDVRAVVGVVHKERRRRRQRHRKCRRGKAWEASKARLGVSADGIKMGSSSWVFISSMPTRGSARLDFGHASEGLNAHLPTVLAAGGISGGPPSGPPPWFTRAPLLN
ncbi:hypothetical protein B0H17DRAFT_1147682 [Mycena rosella]|uniref:Uncharacterized protein n=1 Tax=Mycena rosella TaxID=1033263 RepID=A0AAD7CJV0_MYCRO|nr:hypothetical protein B0H17DRAFT_1147682 [Mycena rosella]